MFADMTPGGADDRLGAPADGNAVINSISVAGDFLTYDVSQYRPKSGNAIATNYTAALQEALGILNASLDPKKLLVFVSDGASNTGGAGFAAAVSAIQATGAVANSIAIAGAMCNTGSAGTLAEIAVNGGACFTVPDPNDVPNLIPNLIGSTLTKVEMTVDAGAPTLLTTVPATPVAGPAMVTYSTMTAGLSPGSHQICVTAFGTDVTGGSASVQTCVTVEVFDLVLTPASATNELGSDNSRMVTATLNGPARAVGGYLVEYDVGGQNPSATGVCNPVACTTNASGVVTFTYSVPVVPASNNPPSGQNPDGFYVLLATDDVDPNPRIRVSDTGSSFVAGPYATGTKIKLTQAPREAERQAWAGEIDWHITLKGDAVVTATDSSGNSASVRCLVPPPPK